MLAIAVIEWKELPEEEYDLTPMHLQAGCMMPRWFKNALVRGDIETVPPAKKGEMGWGRPVRVKKTGCVFPLGSTMTKGDLFTKPL